MSSRDLLLYTDAQFLSPYAMSAFVALHEKGLPFQIATVDLTTGANHEAAFAATSITQRVPALVHDGFTLSESSAIIEYLDEVFPGAPLYPRAPRERARARQVQAWVRSDLMPIRQERPTEVLFRGPVQTPLSAQARACTGLLFAGADALLAHGGDNLFDRWCIADLDLAVMLNRLVLNGDTVPGNLAAYARRQWQRPSVRLWLEQGRPPQR